MGLEGTVDLIFRYEDGTLTVETIEDVVAYVQSVVAQHVAPGSSLVDDLIAKRRAEAAAELGVPAVTADRMWSDLDLGVDVISIR